MNNNKIKIGIAGLGTVGSGVINLLEKNKVEILKRSGFEISIVCVSASNKDKKRSCNIKGLSFYTNPLEMIRNESIDILVELIGGESLAKELVIEALKKKIHVVTANKALIALHGNDISEISNKEGCDVAYEASVAGAVPIIKVIRESLNANEIEWIAGIINGTTNYILTEMLKSKKDFKDVLKEAQELGYAEADPAFDVGGIDAAHKLTILSSICFGIPLNFESIYIEGIESIELDDLNYAKDLGYAIKHLAIGRKNNDGIELRVHSCLIPKTRLIANVDGVKNAVVVSSDAAGPTLYYGAGAGSLATASSVVSDIIDISRKKLSESNNSVPLLSYQRNELQNKKILDINEIESRYYLRIRVTNKPGVLADITKIFGSKSISIESILQKEDLVNDENVPIVLVTHEVVEKNIIEALKDIEKLEVVKGKIIKIRIEELES
ncbi:MAG: homoserine dehydrogenase [Gammaproteobacteria bacterium]|nr:homoserine dehydrogenase [Gammaproteobacteria bacterium]|tara:strand:- start:1229 stop:2548 length:1320 start_codon:yes stop_codon:yes gene_type:complete